MATATPVEESNVYGVRSCTPRWRITWQAVKGMQQNVAQQSSHAPQQLGGMR